MNIGFADLHCHPNLKTFGHSFGNSDVADPRSDVWYHQSLTAPRRAIKNISGISPYSQADFTSMSRGQVKLAFVSLYPFEKGFFINLTGAGKFSAFTANLVTGIGFHRIRNLQQHLDYFRDLELEYRFFVNSCPTSIVDDRLCRWSLVSTSQELNRNLGEDGHISVVLSIEGAHVFNTGLTPFGRRTDEAEVLERIQLIRQWKYPPVFITYAHNFYNELCGHAGSLESLGPLVNQLPGMNAGFTELGLKALHALLDDSGGRPIFLDVKHMSLQARLQYYGILQSEYASKSWLPIVVSHGGVTGCTLNQTESIGGAGKLFYRRDINFFDEELQKVAESEGMFAIQMDTRRLTSREGMKLASVIAKQKKVSIGAVLVWFQLRHIAEVLDSKALPAWDMICIGSDFDGTINPPDGILGAMEYSQFGQDLLLLIKEYLFGKRYSWRLPENGWLDAAAILEKFASGNAIRFLERYLNIQKPALKCIPE